MLKKLKLAIEAADAAYAALNAASAAADVAGGRSMYRC